MKSFFILDVTCGTLVRGFGGCHVTTTPPPYPPPTQSPTTPSWLVLTPPLPTTLDYLQVSIDFYIVCVLFSIGLLTEVDAK